MNYGEKKRMQPVVYIDKLAQAQEALEHQFSKSFELLSLVDDFEGADAIFIKPNLTYPTYKKGVTTQKAFVENLVRALRQINSTTKIYIGEGEGGVQQFFHDRCHACNGLL